MNQSMYVSAAAVKIAEIPDSFERDLADVLSRAPEEIRPQLERRLRKAYATLIEQAPEIASEVEAAMFGRQI